MTLANERRLDVVQRKMLRRMVGWVSSTEDDTWRDIGRKMKLRLERCLTAYPLTDWSALVSERKAALLASSQNWPLWTKLATEWIPLGGFRTPGRPRKRWNG